MLARITSQFLLLCLAGIVWSAAVRAELTIEITGGTAGAQPIAIVPFGWEGQGAPPADIAGIVAADLHRSGYFAPLPGKDLIANPTEAAQVNFADWRVLGTPSLVIGKLRATAGGYVAQFQLFDVFKGTQLAGYSIPSSAQDLRRTAHQISDIIYEALTGQPGAFATRIAYVTEVRGQNGKSRYSLHVADADGHNPIPVLHSTQPIMSPSWSPDGTRLAYVSFERRRPEVFVQDIATRNREVVASYSGINSAPAWSPEGSRLALVLSKDGNPEIYILNLRDKSLRRVTDSPAIDTEPAWSPDGNTLIFTSDRGGRPQLYRVPIGGGKPQRLTFEGDYNAHAAFSPDGKSITMITGQGNRFRAALLDLASGSMQVLSDGRLDESPSFSPNGAIIVYATEAGNRGVLEMVSVDGRVRQRLTQAEGDAREPSWGPRTGRAKH